MTGSVRSARPAWLARCRRRSSMRSTTPSITLRAMTYRADRDADRARIAALEQELAETRDKLAVVEGRQAQALVRATQGGLVAGGRGGAARWFGPGTLQLARRFDGAFPTERFEELIERIREFTRDPGRTELLKSSLTWFASRGEKSIGPFRVVTVTIRDGVSTLTVTDRLAGLAGAIYGGVGGGVSGGGITIPIIASMALPVLTPVFLLGWLGGILLATRAIYRRAAKRRAIALQQLFDALVSDIERTLRA